MSRIRKSKMITVICNHILNNKREYLVIIILFFVGIIFGVFFINNANEIQIEKINEYLRSIILNVKQCKDIDFLNLFKKSIFNNIVIVIILWFGAATIAGNLIIYGTVLAKGFSIGYTISSIINCFGISNGFSITLSLMVLHNIILIPTIFAICVSRYKII